MTASEASGYVPPPAPFCGIRCLDHSWNMAHGHVWNEAFPAGRNPMDTRQGQVCEVLGLKNLDLGPGEERGAVVLLCSALPEVMEPNLDRKQSRGQKWQRETETHLSPAFPRAPLNFSRIVCLIKYLVCQQACLFLVLDFLNFGFLFVGLCLSWNSIGRSDWPSERPNLLHLGTGFHLKEKRKSL